MASLTKACRFKNDCVKARLPIQKNLLLELVQFTENYFLDQNQLYLALLYKTMFLTAYYGLLRVSEIALTDSNHTIRVTDTFVGANKEKILFILRSSKTHGTYARPQLIKISTVEFKNGIQNRPHRVCPYVTLCLYFKHRPRYFNTNEPLFIFKDLSPVTDSHMRSTLHLMLKLMGYKEFLYNCHSFCSGRSCDLLKFGVSVETIKKLGRWTSNVVYSYLKHWY